MSSEDFPTTDYRNRTMRVVIIDDTPVNLALMQALVARVENCETQTFSDPQEGLAHCMSAQPDLMIVGHLMPGLDGIELIRRFRAEPDNQDVPILLVAAAHEKDARYQALEGGATDFLSKPIEKNEFISRARNMLRLRRHPRMLANLATNAVTCDFETNTEGRIRIKAEGEQHAKLMSEDNSRGTPAEQLPRVFDPFFTTKLGRDGTDHGLNIVTGVLGGAIRMRNAAGKCVRFILTIPRRAPQRSDDEPGVGS